MKRLALLTTISLTVVCLGVDRPARGANLVVNGSFESPACTSSTPGQLLGLSGGTVPGWTIPASDGVYPWCLQNGTNIYGAGPTPYGNQWLVLGRVSTGAHFAIQQTLTGLTAGSTYRLSFAIATETGCCSVVEVSFPVGSSTAAKTFTAAASGNYWQVWTTQTMDFVASDTAVTLQFRDVTTGSGGLDLGLDNVSVEASGCNIDLPDDGADFDLTDSDHRSATVTFGATGSGSSTVNWTFATQYTTSGARGPFNDTRSASTTGDAQGQQTFTGVGGQLVITAQFSGCQPKVTTTITGTPIPDDDITTRLVDLYAMGATPHLLTGIAQVESSYQQFATITLFDVSDLWPHESFDGGSHIGLMQMPVAMATAWDWLENTRAGAALFNNKLGSAGRIAQKIRNRHPGLRALSDVETENMAVLLYGPNATGDVDRQYYAPQCSTGQVTRMPGNVFTCVGGTWDWIVNSAGNSAGVGYVDRVRASIE